MHVCPFMYTFCTGVSHCCAQPLSLSVPCVWFACAGTITPRLGGRGVCTTIEPCALGAAGGRPLVIADPMGAVAQQFMSLGAAVVQEVAKLKLRPRNSVRCLTTIFATTQVESHPE